VPLWKRSLYVLWLTQFMTTMAMTLGLTFVPFFLEQDPSLNVKDPGDLQLYTSLILAGPFFTTIVATPFWGWVADRSGRKRQVVRAAFGLGLTQWLMALAETPEQLLAIRILQGAVSGVVAANLGLLSAVTPNEHQGHALTVLQSSTPAGLIFGPVVGGALATTLGFRPVYWLLGGVILLMGIISWLFLKEEGFKPTRSASPWRGLWRATRQAWAHARLRAGFAILVLAQLAWTTAQVVFAIYAGKLIEAWVCAERIEASWWNLGVGFTAIAMTLTGLANFLMSLWWGRAQDRRRRHLTLMGSGIMVVSIAVLALWPAWWVVLLARFGAGSGLGGASTIQYAVISARVAAEDRGQFMGLATAVTHIGNLVGFISGGMLAQLWGESGNFLFAAGIYLFIALFAWRLERAERRAGAKEPAGALASARVVTEPDG
jgi:DHA1 family multidrug resistance protein-like MFS transporter